MNEQAPLSYPVARSAVIRCIARCLWRVLEMGCMPGSIHYRVLPGLRLDAVLHDLRLLGAAAPADPATWWRLVEAA